MYGLWLNNMVGHTELDSIVTKEEPRQDHLTQAETRSKHREEAHGQYAQDIDKHYCQCCVHKAELEDGLCQGTNGEG